MKYLCLNCNNEIKFDEIHDEIDEIITCNVCNWRNELNDTPAIKPIALKTHTFEDYSVQICYPLIEEKDLEELPEKLKEAILTYFNYPEKFKKKHRDNIYHNLYKKNAINLDKMARKYQNKAKLVRYFQNSDLFTHQLIKGSE